MYLWLQRIVIVANIKDIDGCSGKLFTFNPRLDVASLICATSKGFFGVMA
jgi:hypothetical protein